MASKSISKLEKIRQLALNYLDIEESSLILIHKKENNFKEFSKILNNLLRKIQQKNNTEFLNISNYEIFKIFVQICDSSDLNVYNKLSNNKEAENLINSFTYQNHYRDLDMLSTMFDENDNLVGNKAFLLYANLNLPGELLNYNINLAICILKSFLKYKFESIQLKQSIKVMNNIKTNDIYELIHQKNYRFEQCVISIFKEYMSREAKEINKLKEEYKNKIRDYKNFINLIASNKAIDIKQLSSTWENNLNKTLLVELYAYLNENVVREYRDLYNEKTKLSDIINRSPLINYLYNHQINPDTIDNNIIKELETYDFEEVTKIIEFLLRVGFNLNDIINNKLYNLYEHKQIIQELINMIDLNQISLITLNKLINKDILLSTYHNIKTNKTILLDIIDFDNPFYEDKVLLIKTSDLRNRISVLKEYDLLSNVFTFLLCNYNYLYIYDLMLEKNIPVNLFISICKSENPLLTLKKIIICKEINYPYETISHLIPRDISVPGKFICPDSQINFYLDNIINDELFNKVSGDRINDITKTPLVKDLDEKYRFEDLYHFGEVQISRAKALKNLQKIKDDNLSLEDNLILCLTENSILNEYELLQIKKFLATKKLS